MLKRYFEEALKGFAVLIIFIICLYTPLFIA